MAKSRSGGGGLPENPEGRRRGDFGPGGSGGSGASEKKMESRGDRGVRVDPRGSGRSTSTAVDPGEASENLGARPPGRDERGMRNRPTNREQQDNTSHPS